MNINKIQNISEQKRFSIVKIELFGRYMLPDKQEYSCQTQEISIHTLSLIVPEKAKIDDSVIVYLDILGRIEGQVYHISDTGFSLSFNLAPAKVDKFADRLTWLVNRQKLGMMEDRRHQRILPNIRQTKLSLPDGTSLPCQLIDISISGAAIQTKADLTIGAHIIIGKTPGRVVRRFANGLAIEFFRLIPSENFDEAIQL